MSDTTHSDNPAVPEKPPEKTKAKITRTRGQKWRRRIILILSLFILGVVVVRSLVPILLPTVMRNVAGRYGLNAEYDQLDFYMLGGDVGFWNLRFTPKAGGEPVLQVDYCRGSVSTLGLLRGKIRVGRAEAEGADVTVERDADGSIPLLKQLLASPSAAPAPTASTTTNIPLEPPLTVRALRLQNAQAHLVDRAVTPATNFTFMLNMILTDIGSAESPTRFSVQVSSPEMLGALYVDGEGTSRNKRVDATMAIRMLGLNAVAAQPYLAAFGITPVSSDISAAGSGKLEITPSGGQPNDPPDAPVKAVAAKLTFDNLTLTSESKSAASVKSIVVDAPTIAPGEIRVASVLVDGVTASAWRDEQGRLGFAGIAIGSAPGNVVAPATQPAVQVAAPASAMVLPILELKSLRATNVDLSFVDSALAPAVRLGLLVDSADLTGVSTDPADADKPAKIDVRARAAGLANSIQLSGDLTTGKPLKTLDLKLAVAGIDAAALDPYFTRLGIKREFADANFNCTLHGDFQSAADGSTVLGFKASDIQFADEKTSWINAQNFQITDLTIAPDASRIGVKSIDIVGPAINVRRAANGSVTALGLTFDPNAPRPGIGPQVAIEPPTSQPAGNMTTQPATASTKTAIRLPALAIGSFHWSGLVLAVEDAMSVPPVSVGLRELDISFTNFVLDPQAVGGQPGELKAYAKLPGNLEHFVLNGTLVPTANSLAIEAHGSASGLTLEAIKPLLLGLGLEPTLKSGTITFVAGANLRQQDETALADVSVKRVLFIDGDQTWGDLEGVEVTSISLAGTKLDVAGIDVRKPVLKLHRDQEGIFSAMGMRLVPAVSGKPAQASNMAGSTVVPSNAPATEAAAIPSQLDLSLPLTASLSSLNLRGAQLLFDDESLNPGVAIAPTLDASIEELVLGADARPASIEANLAVPGVIEKLSVNGFLQAAPTTQSVALELTGTGVSGAALQPYMPAGMTPSATSGDFKANLVAKLSHHPQGGSAIQLIAGNVLFNDHLSTDPAIKLTTARLVVSQLDLPANLIAIDDITVKGFSLRAMQKNQGFVLPGIIVGASTPVSVPTSTTKPADPQVASVSAPTLAELAKQASVKPPLVTIKTLDIGADRIAIQTAGMAEPVAMTDISLINTTPIELLGDDPKQRPAFDLSANAKVEKLVDSIAVKARLAPLAPEPAVWVGLEMSGIRGAELTRIVPALSNYLHADDLKDAKFYSELDSQFTFARRGIFGIDMTREIGANFTVRHTAFTQADLPKPIAAVQEIRGERVRFSPLNGSLSVQTLDIATPSARIVRDAAGIHLLGLTIKDPSQKQPASTQPASAPAKSVAAAPEPPTSQPSVAEAVEKTLEQRAGGDFKIDTLTLSGIDLVIEDRIGQPVTVLPIIDLDAEIKGLNSRALTETLPIRFNVLVSAGKLELPKDNGKSEETESRDVFSQLTASGRLSVYPKPDGWIKMSLSGFDLAAVRGLAQEQGIKLGGGTFDFAADVRMQGADTFEARLYPTLTDLSVSEDPNGPIQRIFKLPAPLDVAIDAVQDIDGSISLPVRAPMKAGELDTGAIIGSAVGAIGGQVAAAIVAAPMKIAAIGGGLLGIDFSTDREKDLQPIVISYPAGESQPTTDQLAQVEALARRLRNEAMLQVQLSSALASGDVVLAEQRANPSRADAQQIAERLRTRKFDLQRQSVELGSTLRVALASQNQALADQTLTTLQQSSTELAQTEEALDEMLNLLRPGAEKQADRRTKASAIELGQLRLATVKEVLRASGIKDFNDRVTEVRPTPSAVAGQSSGAVTLVLSRQAKK